MSVVVQKYGGSSVADVARIRAVARRVVATVKSGHQVVVAVSAMGNTTSELLALARSVSQTPGRRELDLLISVGERVSMTLLAMAIQDLGVDAASFTGSHRFVMDYLLEEVLPQQPEYIQTFLLRTSILDRLCGSLCEAVCSCETLSSSKGNNPPPLVGGVRGGGTEQS